MEDSAHDAPQKDNSDTRCPMRNWFKFSTPMLRPWVIGRLGSSDGNDLPAIDGWLVDVRQTDDGAAIVGNDERDRLRDPRAMTLAQLGADHPVQTISEIAHWAWDPKPGRQRRLFFTVADRELAGALLDVLAPPDPEAAWIIAENEEVVRHVAARTPSVYPVLAFDRIDDDPWETAWAAGARTFAIPDHLLSDELLDRASLKLSAAFCRYYGKPNASSLFPALPEPFFLISTPIDDLDALWQHTHDRHLKGIITNRPHDAHHIQYLDTAHLAPTWTPPSAPPEKALTPDQARTIARPEHDLPDPRIRLWLDDLRPPPDRSWTWAKTVERAIGHLDAGPVQEISLDNDLGPDEPEGRKVALWMAEHDSWPTERITIHSANVVAAEAMAGIIQRHGPFEKALGRLIFERTPNHDGNRKTR